MRKRIRVLIVDDSAIVRNILSEYLAQDPSIEVVGKVGDAFQARDFIVKFKPDVMTLDICMPKMDGFEFLRKLIPQYPIAVVMLSALSEKGQILALDCMAAGAVDFVAKPQTEGVPLTETIVELIEKIKIAATIDPLFIKNSGKLTGNIHKKLTTEIGGSHDVKVIVIGASTGGCNAITDVVSKLPSHTPGMVICLHMPSNFTDTFAQRLSDRCIMEVKEAVNGDVVKRGRVLVAPDGMHIYVLKVGNEYVVRLREGLPVNGFCPAVDVLMESVAKEVGRKAIGILLTGIGQDGALGLRAMRESGSMTIAQNEATCAVYGMPKEAVRIGAVDRLLPIQQIPQVVIKSLDFSSVERPKALAL